MYFDAIAKIVSERTGCDVADVKPESKFSELGIDSLDTVELLMSLEDEIGIEIELDQKVETIDDLDREESAVNDKLNSLVKERRCVYNKIRRCRNPDTKEKLQRDVATLSEEIKGLRKEVKLYEDIKVRSLSMKNKLTKIKEERKEREQYEHRRRNSRSGRKNVIAGD